MAPVTEKVESKEKLDGSVRKEKRISDSVIADRIEWKKEYCVASTPIKIGQEQEDNDGKTAMLSQKLLNV